jgi:hypothetical protein
LDYDHYTKQELIDMLASLEREFDNLKAAMESLPKAADLRATNREDPYALFEPFTDDPENCLVLVNMAYHICYLNSPGTELLQIGNPEAFYERNIFDLLKLKHALKLKEVIDRTYVSGKDGKLKDLRLIKPSGGTVKVKVRTRRVRYDDSPAVQLKLKPA